MADPAAALRVAAAYQRQIATARELVVTQVRRSWINLPDYRDASIEAFAARAAAMVGGGQAHTAALTDAYLARFEELMLGQPVKPVGVPAKVLDGIRGDVSPLEVYRRPGVTVWTALGNGKQLADAVASGLARAEALAATDLQLAKTHSSRFVLGSKDNVSGYRRVLEGSGPCELCIAAAADTYGSEDLMPIHPHCDCGVEPIISGAPSIDDGTGGEGSGDGGVDVVVHEHGEIGPVLAVAGQNFTGPDDI